MSKNRNLAGLAALGALGYMMARGGKKPPAEAAATPVEDRGSMARALIEDDRESQRGEFNPAGLKRNTETGEMYDPSGDVLGGRFTGRQRPVVSTPGGRVQPTRSMAPATSARDDTTSLARETARAGRGAIAAMGNQNPQRGPAFSNLEEMRAINAGRENITDLTREMSRGVRGRIPVVGTQNPQRGPTAEELFEYRRSQATDGMKKGGVTKKMASGGSVNSASRRGDGIAQRGKTKGRMR
jgi:hypothetical protein